MPPFGTLLCTWVYRSTLVPPRLFPSVPSPHSLRLTTAFGCSVLSELRASATKLFLSPGSSSGDSASASCGAQPVTRGLSRRRQPRAAPACRWEAKHPEHAAKKEGDGSSDELGAPSPPCSQKLKADIRYSKRPVKLSQPLHERGTPTARTQMCPLCTHTSIKARAVTGSRQSILKGWLLISSQEKPPSYTGDCASLNLLARFPLAPLAERCAYG